LTVGSVECQWKQKYEGKSLIQLSETNTSEHGNKSGKSNAGSSPVLLTNLNNMKRNINIDKLRSRKRLWDVFGWFYKSINALSKNHSLNDSSGYSRCKTSIRRLSNKRDRILSKKNINNIV
jgi:hypothetical protein